MDRSGNSSTATVTVQRVAQTQPEIRIVSGNNQTAPISSLLQAPIVVTLVDAAGVPQSGRPVLFRLIQNNGSLNGGAATVSSYQNGVITQSVVVNTDGQGKASVQWTLGARAGAGNQQVEASSVGFQGPVVFTATGLEGAASQINVDTGEGQVGATGSPLPFPFVVVVTDAGHNRLRNIPVIFTVTQGAGNINGLTSVTQNTDSDGRALVTLTLGLQDGIENNRVEATFTGNTAATAKFSATARTPGDRRDFDQWRCSGQQQRSHPGCDDAALPALLGPAE